MHPGQNFTVFSNKKIDNIREMIGWLKAAEEGYEFWNNEADADYDTL